MSLAPKPQREKAYVPHGQIWDTTKINFKERTDFLKSNVGMLDHVRPVEEICNETRSNAPAAYEIRSLSGTYIELRNRGARLPKFTRWVTGMFAGNKDYANFLAAEAAKATARRIYLSCDLIDILRCADTPHFGSCFAYKGGEYEEEGAEHRSYKSDYGDMPKRIAEECEGIAIAYIDDENGHMLGRFWLHHAIEKKTGEPLLVVATGYYGCMSYTFLAQLLADNGLRVGVPRTAGIAGVDIPIEYVGCFKESVHHDLYTWLPNPTVRIIPTK